jgi:pyruvate dehydrogenase E2 component (dihydrolipoamide acetyltransferase)
MPAEYEDVPLSGIRKIIAKRMYESLQKTAQLTINMTANAAALQAMRKRVKAQGDSADVANITINDMILFAVSRMLLKHPAVNATFADGVYRQYKSVNLAFACSTPRGLMVPVIFGADRLSLDAISRVTKDYAAQAREGSINPDLLTGGTITVSNLGMLGVTDFTPVLNYPQAAILGVNAIRVKPVRRDGEVVFEDHVGLSLTINHQVIDGWDAGLFLRDVCQAIENFDILLMQG